MKPSELITKIENNEFGQRTQEIICHRQCS